MSPRLLRLARHPLVVGCASGLLFCLSIPKADLHLAAWVCLVPAFLLLPGMSRRDAFAMGLSAGLAAGAGRAYWISETLELYGGLSLPLAITTNLLLIAYLALYWAAFFVAATRLRPGALSFPWLAGAAWVLLEWVQSWMISGFPWELVGYSQYGNLPVLQLASVTGIYGLSYVLVAINASVALAASRQPWRERLRPLLPAVVLVVGVCAWGGSRIRSLDAEIRNGEPLRVGIAQGNVPQGEKWRQGRAEAATRRYLDVAGRLPAGALDLVVLPETALPYYFEHPRYASQASRISALARQLDAPMLVGTLGGSWEEGIYNRAYLLDRRGKTVGHADKVHLVPFGEYLPLRFLFQYLEGLTTQSGAFLPGAEHAVLALPDSEVRLGVFVCFESVFPRITRSLVNGGATVLVNTTNDAWFGVSSAPYQHLSMAVVRAVESGRPVVRAANTGVSCLIEPSGRVVNATRLLETRGLTVHPVPRLGKTFYVAHGDLFLALCGLLLVAYSSAALRRRPWGA